MIRMRLQNLDRQNLDRRLWMWAIVAWLCAAPPATAEWMIDLYGGGGFVNNTDVSITRDTAADDISTASIDAHLKNVDIDDFPTGGLRLGYWFATRDQLLGFDVGLSLDLFYYALKIPSQSVRANSNVRIEVAIEDERFVIEPGEDQSIDLPSLDTDDTAVIAPEIMLRRPLLISPAFPNGRLQPYITFAPALLFTDYDPNISVGIKVGAGLAWQLHRHFALVAEYRFTYFEFDTDSATLLVEGVVIEQPDIEADLKTHFIVAGVSFRF
jgi:opacity protein-like surface antigen